MGQARLIAMLATGWLAVAGAASPTTRARAAQSRFMSYASEAQCAAGRILAASVCRSAFANARSEFEAKTPSFGSLAACARVYGSCAAWPPGTASRSSFRPTWDGVDIVDTPTESSVTPAIPRGSQRVRFASRPLTGDDGGRELVVRGGRRLAPASSGLGVRAARAARRPGSESETRGSPGGGFTMTNGVLSFPAPARFAPKVLPKAP